MNRVSAFGNLEKAGDKRIATREKLLLEKVMGLVINFMMILKI